MEIPLHLAALHSNSVALIEKLIQIHPPALRMRNNDTFTPFTLVFQNTSPMAPKILRAFLQADPELIEIRNEKALDLPIHCCIRRSGNPNVLAFLSILLETNHDLVNSPTCHGFLPIHLASFCSTAEVMQMLYNYSPSSINVNVPCFDSVAHLAACRKKLNILNYIHTINPELIVMTDNKCRTPLSWAVASRDSDCDFIKALCVLGPTAISKVQFY